MGKRTDLINDVLAMRPQLEKIENEKSFSPLLKVNINELFALNPVLDYLELDYRYGVWVYAAQDPFMPVVFHNGKFWFHLNKRTATLLVDLKIEAIRMLKRHREFGNWKCFADVSAPARPVLFPSPSRVKMNMLAERDENFSFAPALVDVHWRMTVELMLVVLGKLDMAIVHKNGEQLRPGLTALKKLSNGVYNIPFNRNYDYRKVVMFRLSKGENITES